jgi:hypothetical protein
MIEFLRISAKSRGNLEQSRIRRCVGDESIHSAREDLLPG